MNDAQLKIVISVINDAAAQLSEVGTQLSSLGLEGSAAASEMSSAMSGAAGSIESSLTAAEEAAADAALQTAQSWLGASDEVQTAVAGAAQSAEGNWTDLSAVSAETASQVREQWATEGAAMEADLASAMSSIDEDFNQTAAVGEEAGKKLESSVSSVGGKFQALGIQLSILGAAIAAPAVEAVKAAGDQQDAFDQLSNTVANVYTSAAAPTAGYATEVADLTAKINEQKAAVAEAGAKMQQWTGSTVAVAASHEKAAASAATAQINIQKLEQQLDQLTNSQKLAGGSASDTATQFEQAARANTSLGFSVTDSAGALQLLFASTNSVSETMTAYQDAMDLSAARGLDLETATNDVIQAMNGQGRALRDLGVQVADGLSGQTALSAIQEKVAGSAEEAATHGLGPYTVAVANLNKAMADFGTTVLPALTTFLEDITAIINKIDAWAQAHPKLAEALLVFLGLIGGILLVVGPLITFFGLMVIGIEAFTTALAAMEITLVAAIGLTLAYTAVFLAIAAVVALVIVYHKQIMDAIKAAWDWIVNFVKDHWQMIVDILFPGVGTLVAFLFDHWGTIKSDVEDAWNWIANFISTIWSKIVSAAQTAIATVEGLINKIMAPINAVTTAVSGIASGISNAVGGTIKAFASGGIVSSPTLALVGEAGPEAIIPLSAFNGGPGLSAAGGAVGGGNIIVNINGGSYLDSNGANQIAQALARQIGVQLRLKNYA